MGGELVVRWRSDAPISTICFKRPWRVASLAIHPSPVCCVAVVYASGEARERGNRQGRFRPVRSLEDRLPEYLFQRGEPLPDLLQPGHPQADHALLDGLSF